LEVEDREKIVDVKLHITKLLNVSVQGWLGVEQSSESSNPFVDAKRWLTSLFGPHNRINDDVQFELISLFNAVDKEVPTS
jgi:hypothetical protein